MLVICFLPCGVCGEEVLANLHMDSARTGGHFQDERIG